MREWLLNLPCVIRGEIIVDVRGPNLVLIKGITAKVAHTREDVIAFVLRYVD